MTEPLLTDRAGVARLLDISTRTVSRLDDGGRIPQALMLGTCKRWNVEEIKAWMRAGAPRRREWAEMREMALLHLASTRQE